MSKQDLRSWIAAMEAAGEIQHVSGANHLEEIGGIVDIYMRKMGNPAVLFDDVPGYPKGHRVLANILTSVPRVNIALGLPPDATELDQIQWWRKYFKDAPMKPTKAVNGGPLLDNVLSGAEVVADAAVPGARVKVRFAGQDVDGYVVERTSTTDHTGRLQPLRRVVSPEPVLAPEVALLRALC